MSQVTRCPACSTMFRVVPDQLRISAGWVRCGKCAEVFEATAHLQAVTAPARMPAPEQSSAGAPPVRRSQLAAPAGAAATTTNSASSATRASATPAPDAARPNAPPVAAAATAQADAGSPAGKPPALAAPVSTKSAAPMADGARVAPTAAPGPLAKAPAPLAVPAQPATSAAQAASARATVAQQPAFIAAPSPSAANLRASRPAIASVTASAAPLVSAPPEISARPAAPGTAPSTRVAAGLLGAETAQTKMPARTPVQTQARVPEKTPPKVPAPPQQAKKAAAPHFPKDEYLDDLPELDSLLVVYPDEIEAFERELASATPPGAKPAVPSVPAALSTASTAREWPPLDTPDFDATRISGDAGSNAASIKRPRKASRDNSSPMLLQASTSDASEERSHSGPVDLSEPAPLPVKSPSRARPRTRTPKPERAAAEVDPSFVRSARRDAFWRRSPVRLGVGLVCLLLVCALAFQWLVQERDRIAAASPAMRPLVYGVCRVVGCTVAPQRQIESMVIDSSSFNKNRGDAYQLSLTLKNLSGLELATPAIEVTLTDSQDQALIRRVVLPAELGVPAVMSARSERSATLPISISSGGGVARVSGYRLLAFYP